MNTEAQVDLAAAARLCSDLAQVKDAGQLPALLARAAELLDASGIVLWLAGPEGTVLRPAASVGYSDHTLSRMKALSGRSDNAVSVAFREGRTEVVGGTKERNGAVVVPIVTVGGRTGAMAAEIRHGAESSPSVQALVTIVAAQLASLVADTTTT
jgi:GAF domain-containing protein